MFGVIAFDPSFARAAGAVLSEVAAVEATDKQFTTALLLTRRNKE
jgi:hypothetical protein